MPFYQVKFKGGGPKLESKRTTTYKTIKASNPTAALGKALRMESQLGWKLPKGAWTDIQILREL